jgi:uncharacterized repeat protein (TIGR03803 family)
MSRTFVLQSIVFSVSFSFLAACSGSGGSTSGPLPQTGALAVGAAQRSVSSSAVLRPPAITYKSLYSFSAEPDGGSPAGLTDMNGVFYGSTASGGVNGNEIGGYGTIFEMSASGTERVLYSFQGGTDGAFPYAGLTAVNGVLYGATYGGDANDNGTIFEVNTSGVERVLYNFKGGKTDGANPYADLSAANGVLYGTTARGGANNAGTVFEVSKSGVESVLHSFGAGTDGSTPHGRLIDVNGTLYGVTALGGACQRQNCGTVFAVNPSGVERDLPAPFQDQWACRNRSALDG